MVERLTVIEKDLGPTRAERTSQLQSTLQSIREDVDAERFDKAEAPARQALKDASAQLKNTALHQEAAYLLVTILLARRNRNEAEEIVASFFGVSDLSPSKALLILAARLLAETGRAALAARALFHLAGVELPPAASLHPDSEPSGGTTPLSLG